MQLHTIRDGKQLYGKRVLLRIDANVPIKKREVVEGSFGKVARAAVDIEWLCQHGAKVIIMSHLGRPGGKRLWAYSLAPIAKRLETLLHMEIPLCRDIIGPDAQCMAEALKEGKVLLLENLRFQKGEEENQKSFAMALARLGDLYMNDAFADSHRAHASIDAITEELPSYAGPLLLTEIRLLESIRKRPSKPFFLFLGGKKMETKIPLLEHFLPLADAVLLGGALAHPFLQAKGFFIGASLMDPKEVPLARKLLKRFGEKIILPMDVGVVRSLRSRKPMRIIPVESVQPKDIIVDIGKKTMELYTAYCQRAKTIVWNGPFGYCEQENFCIGTHTLARSIAARTGKAKTVVGGGDTLPAIESAHVANKFTLLSTGGGAMLAFLSGEVLPGIEALRKN
jgi:3-phosphoglycerate kinase